MVAALLLATAFELHQAHPAPTAPDESARTRARIEPPRGGNPALTDEQVKAAVRWMVARAK